MSDRKESILRTLQLQNEQLGEWEHKRTISRDPDEKRLCDDKIKDLKALIAGGEAELKKLKGGRQARSTYVDPGTVARQTEHNEIGFNADRHFSENNFGQDLTAGSFHNQVGDDFDPGEIKISPAANTVIRSEGNASGDREFENTLPVQFGNKIEESKKPFLMREDFSALVAFLSAGLLTLAGISFGQKELTPSAAYILAWCLVSCTLIWGIYKFMPVAKGLKLSFAFLVLSVFGGIIFWNNRILKSGETDKKDVASVHTAIVKPAENDGKAVGEVVIIPLIIASIGVILTLANEEYKKNKK